MHTIFRLIFHLKVKCLYYAVLKLVKVPINVQTWQIVTLKLAWWTENNLFSPRPSGNKKELHLVHSSLRIKFLVAFLNEGLEGKLEVKVTNLSGSRMQTDWHSWLPISCTLDYGSRSLEGSLVLFESDYLVVLLNGGGSLWSVQSRLFRPCMVRRSLRNILFMENTWNEMLTEVEWRRVPKV